MSHVNDLDLHKRLRRAEGHLSGVVRMVEEGRDALLLAQQLQAVIKALEKAKHSLIHDHLDHHLGAGLGVEQREKLSAEFREITKYL